MLFLVHHTHTSESCPAGTVKPVKNFHQKIDRAVKSSGIHLIAAYGDYPAHTLYFVLDAKSVEQLHNFADPLLMTIGTTRIHPVAKM